MLRVHLVMKNVQIMINPPSLEKGSLFFFFQNNHCFVNIFASRAG